MVNQSKLLGFVLKKQNSVMEAFLERISPSKAGFQEKGVHPEACTLGRAVEVRDRRRWSRDFFPFLFFFFFPFSLPPFLYPALSYQASHREQWERGKYLESY